MSNDPNSERNRAILAARINELFHIEMETFYRDLVDRRLPLLEAVYSAVDLPISALIGVAMCEAGVSITEYSYKAILEPDNSISLAFSVDSMDSFWKRLDGMASVLLNRHGITRWSISDGITQMSYHYCPRDRAWMGCLMKEAA